MLWLEQMLQWQSEELKDVYNWIQRDFEEVDEMAEMGAPGDRIELKRMALEQLEEIEDKCKGLEDNYARDCLG